ncbi:MAG: tetratricopeptide repeat protein [Acetobacteraceae bacterium]|nr:tetratricopeptide repeat protein [Acetobacteraceae bacterium]
MTDIRDAFEAGDLAAALAAATAAVRAKPREAGMRWLLAEMLLFSGQVERADRALDAVIEEQPSPAVLEFRRLLRAEETRRQVFVEGAPPKFQGDDASPAQIAALRAVTEGRLGDMAAAVAAAAEAEALRARTPGRVELGDGSTQEFDDLRDVDDVFAPTIEVITTGGDYIWIPVERLASLEFEAARRPRDLYWRRTAITLKDGTEGVVYLPAIYPWSGTAPSPALLLGRETDWVGDGEAAGPVRGIGQRVLLAGEEALPLRDAAVLSFT